MGLSDMMISAVREEVSDGGVCTVKAKSLLVAVVCINFLACLSAALADGKVFLKYNKQADILQPTQKVYLRWDGSEEKLVIQTKYEGPAEEMVWIVPVPAEPKVTKGDPNLFEKLSVETRRSDISHTDFPYLDDIGGGSAARGARDVVQWRRRIGDYDVALLKPAGGENVLRWLSANQFIIEDKAVPVLEDYIKEKWWMVAARIHPDALTDITRNRLAQGLLDPLDMTFPSAQCIYPLRLTQFVAGPVEELIYIEGQSHFQPVGSSKGWEMDVFGGPQRITSENQKHLSSVEFATLAAAGKTTKNVVRHLTKLRKVFQPGEMKSDVVFEKMDYVNLLSLGGNDHIGQAATQYGRHSDPAGIPHLLSLLSANELQRRLPAAENSQGPHPRGQNQYAVVLSQLPQCEHLRGCIWALGEIVLEHGRDRAIEDTLVRCARHHSQPIRMEAYIALTKAGFSDLGGILLDRFPRILDRSKEYRGFGWSGEGWILRSEADVITDWIEQHGTPANKHAFAGILMKAIGELPARAVTKTTTDEWDHPVLYGWPEWLIARAVDTRDSDVLPILQKLRESVPDANGVVSFLLKAEAACGSREAIPVLARRMAEDQSRILRARNVHTGGNDSVPARMNEQLFARVPLEQRPPMLDSLTQRIIRNRGARSDGVGRILDVPAETVDAIIRTTLSDHELDDWYVLYLLAQIKKPQDRDREMILSLWKKKDLPKQMTIVDVLWLWQDSKTLLALRAQGANGEVLSELDRAVTSLKGPQ
ncbi:MAG: DUF2330 domain-containing protein [Planctomycetes bacterium]|nr:DUF2330 domain-containing protein [Planctomycetota bacterium]